MSILTGRQTSELHRAIVQYLAPLLENNPQTLNEVTQVLQVEPDAATVPNYLEKKWSTVLRLQKKILDLENEVNSYKSLIDSANSGSGPLVPAKDKLQWLPTASSKTFPTQSAQIVNSVALHPKLPLLVGACSDGSMMAWNLAAEDPALPQKSWNGHTRSVHKIRWSPSEISLAGAPAYLLASCSSDLSIKIWEGDTLKHVRTLTGHGHTVSGVCFSPTEPLLYSVSRDKAVKIWDLVTGYCIKTFVGHSDWVRDLDVASVNSALSLAEVKKSDLGEFVLTCSNDHSVRLSHSSGTGLCMLLGHSHVVETARFLPMYSSQYVDTFLLQNMDKFPYLSEAIVQNPIYRESLGFKYCVSAGRDNVIKLWLLAPPVLSPHRPPTPSGQNNSQGWHILDFLGHQSWVRTLDIHPSGKYIVSGSDDKTIRVWDLASLPERGNVVCCKTLAGHEGFVNAVHFAPYEIPTSEAEKTVEPGQALEIVEKSMRCLFASAGTDNTVRVWS